MSTGLFSTYRQGENRITATLLAVLQRLTLANIDRILQGILGETTFQLVSFDNQVKGQRSVPDARISGAPAVWIETKTVRRGKDQEQLERHLRNLEKEDKLVLLTPDDVQPQIVTSIGDRRLIWNNFQALSDAIDTILQDENDPPTEREAFLLREYVALLQHEGLLRFRRDVVLVVAARNAWPEYKLLHAYICQLRRSFQPAAHIAFYSEGKIHEVVPRIIGSLEEVYFDENLTERVPARLRGLTADLMKRIADHSPQRMGDTSKVLFLSSPESSQTERLDAGVNNDRGAAFTQNQRYVFLTSLKSNPQTTTELLAQDHWTDSEPVSANHSGLSSPKGAFQDLGGGSGCRGHRSRCPGHHELRGALPRPSQNAHGSTESLPRK